MLPHPFAYHRPESLEAAFELYSRLEGDVAFFAGGTELLLALKARVLRYDHLIDLKRIPGLSGIAERDDCIEIGGLTSHHLISTNPIICAQLPAYAALSNNIANIRVRVAGTIGGNLCFAEPHADPPALLAAMGASIVLQGAGVQREVRMGDFIESEFTTAKSDNEVLTHIRIPRPAAGARFCFKSFGHLERPAVSVAAGYVPSDRGNSYHVWVGAIGERPLQLEEIETALQAAGEEAAEDVVRAAAQRVAESLPASSDLHGSADYKCALARTFICECVREVIPRAAHA